MKEMKDKIQNSEQLPSMVGLIVALLIYIGVGVGGYFYIKQVWSSTGQSDLSINIVIAIGCAIGLLVAHFGKRLLSIPLIKITATFFKRTQWLWFALIICAILILSFINKG